MTRTRTIIGAALACGLVAGTVAATTPDSHAAARRTLACTANVMPLADGTWLGGRVILARSASTPSTSSVAYVIAAYGWRVGPAQRVVSMPGTVNGYGLTLPFPPVYSGVPCTMQVGS